MSFVDDPTPGANARRLGLARANCNPVDFVPMSPYCPSGVADALDRTRCLDERDSFYVSRANGRCTSHATGHAVVPFIDTHRRTEIQKVHRRIDRIVNSLAARGAHRDRRACALEAAVAAVVRDGDALSRQTHGLARSTVHAIEGIQRRLDEILLAAQRPPPNVAAQGPGAAGRHTLHGCTSMRDVRTRSAIESRP